MDLPFFKRERLTIASRLGDQIDLLALYPRLASKFCLWLLLYLHPLPIGLLLHHHHHKIYLLDTLVRLFPLSPLPNELDSSC